MPEAVSANRAVPKARRRARLRAVATLDDRVARFSECRAMGHEWSHRGTPNTEEANGYRRPIGAEGNSLAFTSTCRVCGTARVKWLGRSGSYALTRYTYPDGYARRGDEERMTLQEWRSAWVVRALGE